MGKNQGTTIRTIVTIIAVLNTAIVQIGEVDFGNHAVNVAYKVVSYIFLVIATASSHYYNNDFTEVASRYTADMRIEKARLDDPTYADSFAEDDGSRVVDDEEDDEIDAVEFTEGGDEE